MNILWNVYVFASTYMNLDKFNPSKWSLEKVKGHMKPEDLWILSRTQRLIESVTESFENYHIHEAVRMLRDFMVEDVSRWYIRLIRRKTWIEEEDPEKLASYSVLYNVLKTFLILAAPVIPFITEKIYQHVFRPAEPNLPESIHMNRWPKPDPMWRNSALEEAMEVAREVVEASAKVRQRAGLKLRQPVKRLYLRVPEALAEKLKLLIDVLKEQVNVKEVSLLRPDEEEALWVEKATPNMPAVGRKFRSKAPLVAEAIKGLTPNQLKELRESGRCMLEVEGEVFEVRPEHVSVEKMLREGLAYTEFSHGVLYLDTRIDRALQAEGLGRDLVRRVQYMRKEMDLPVDAYIEVYVKAPSAESLSLLESTRDYIAGEVRAKRLVLTTEEIPETEYRKEWDLEDGKYLIGINRLG